MGSAYLVRLEQDALDQIAGIEDYISEHADAATASGFVTRILGRATT